MMSCPTCQIIKINQFEVLKHIYPETYFLLLCVLSGSHCTLLFFVKIRLCICRDMPPSGQDTQARKGGLTELLNGTKDGKRGGRNGIGEENNGAD